MNAGSAAVQNAYGSANEWALMSFFGRVNYDYKGKYLAEANLRYDGSSRIHPDSRWGAFRFLLGRMENQRGKFY